jgi:hypothetical protein
MIESEGFLLTFGKSPQEIFPPLVGGEEGEGIEVPVVHPMHHVGCMASPEPHMVQGPPYPSPIAGGGERVRRFQIALAKFYLEIVIW